MRKFLYLILIVFGFNKCVSSNLSIVGHYYSPSNTFFNYVLYGNIIKCTLDIYSDSGFKFCTCAQITKGKWLFTGNELKLICTEKKFIIDSFNYKTEYRAGTICNKDTFVFILKKSILQKEIKINNKKYYFILRKK